MISFKFMAAPDGWRKGKVVIAESNISMDGPRRYRIVRVHGRKAWLRAILDGGNLSRTVHVVCRPTDLKGVR